MFQFLQNQPSPLSRIITELLPWGVRTMSQPTAGLPDSSPQRGGGRGDLIERKGASFGPIILKLKWRKPSFQCFLLPPPLFHLLCVFFLMLWQWLNITQVPCQEIYSINTWHPSSGIHGLWQTWIIQTEIKIILLLTQKTKTLSFLPYFSSLPLLTLLLFFPSSFFSYHFFLLFFFPTLSLAGNPKFINI